MSQDTFWERFWSSPYRKRMKAAARADTSHATLSTVTQLQELQACVDGYYADHGTRKRSYEDDIEFINEARKLIPQRILLVGEAAQSLLEFESAMNNLNRAEKPIASAVIPVVTAAVTSAMSGGLAGAAVALTAPSVHLSLSKFSEKQKQLIERTPQFYAAYFIMCLYSLNPTTDGIIGFRCWGEPTRDEDARPLPTWFSLNGRGPGFP